MAFAQPLAIGHIETTFAEWDASVAMKGCRHIPKDEGWGRGARPVIYVLWDDARQYVAWLSATTGQPYRLLTEAEWEYAARAGTTTPFSFGSTISTDQANYDGNSTYGAKKKGTYRQKTIDVGNLNAPNAFGLHDMHGNVWEWVEDCWIDSYTSAAPDASVRATNCTDSKLRVLRGGSWYNNPKYLRAAIRNRYPPGSRIPGLGLRVARPVVSPRTP